MTFELTLKRRPEFLVMNILLPATMMSLLSALVFCLPAESGEKVGLGITVLLSFSVILLMITDITPRIGQPMPIISKSDSLHQSLIIYLQYLLTLSLHTPCQSKCSSMRMVYVN